MGRRRPGSRRVECNGLTPLLQELFTFSPCSSSPRWPRQQGRQLPGDAVQNLLRQNRVRDRSRQSDRAETCAQLQDRAGAAFSRIRDIEQTLGEREIVLDPVSEYLARGVVAAPDITQQCAQRTALAGGTPMRLAQVVAHRLREVFCTCFPYVEALECNLERLGHKFVARFKMLVETADCHAGFLHDVGNANAVQPKFPKASCGDIDDPLMRCRLLCL